MQKFRIYNAYKYTKNWQETVVIESLNVGKETRYPKKIFISVPEAEALLGSSLKDEFGLWFNQKVLEVEEVYGLSSDEK